MAADPGAVLPRQRNWPRRLLIGINLFLVVCLLVAGSGYLYLHWRFGQINKVTIGSIFLHPDSGGQPMNVLMVGSDSRAKLTGAEARRAGKSFVTGQRSDTIMVLHIDPREKHAAILSIPRDLSSTGRSRSYRRSSRTSASPSTTISRLTSSGSATWSRRWEAWRSTCPRPPVTSTAT